MATKMPAPLPCSDPVSHWLANVQQVSVIKARSCSVWKKTDEICSDSVRYCIEIKELKCTPPTQKRTSWRPLECNCESYAEQRTWM